jgi:hypothetical protein
MDAGHPVVDFVVTSCTVAIKDHLLKRNCDACLSVLTNFKAIAHQTWFI